MGENLARVYKAGGKVKHGHIYHLAEYVTDKPWNRLPCPRCEEPLHYYRNVWANQHGCEQAYHCDTCKLDFRVWRVGELAYINFRCWGNGGLLLPQYLPPEHDDFSDMPF